MAPIWSQLSAKARDSTLTARAGQGSRKGPGCLANTRASSSSLGATSINAPRNRQDFARPRAAGGNVDGGPDFPAVVTADELVKLQAENERLRQKLLQVVEGLKSNKREELKEKYIELTALARKAGVSLGSVPAQLLGITGEELPQAPASPPALNGESSTGNVFKYNYGNSTVSAKVEQKGDYVSFSFDEPNSGARRPEASSHAQGAAVPPSPAQIEGMLNAPGGRSGVNPRGMPTIAAMGADEAGSKSSPTPAGDNVSSRSGSGLRRASTLVIDRVQETSSAWRESGPEHSESEAVAAEAPAMRTSGPVSRRKVRESQRDDAGELDDVEVAATTAEEDKQAALLRAAARREVAEHTAEEATADRHHWLVFTVPEAPVAGEDVVIYFNKNQSEALRSSPKLQALVAFNQWELQAEPSKVEMTPTKVPSETGADFWSVRVTVPKETFELNFVFSDGEQAFDNNLGKDFTFPVVGGITLDDWLDGAAERAAAAEEARQAKEREEAAKAELEREAREQQLDLERAQQRAAELRGQLEWLREGVAPMWEMDYGSPSARTLWRVEPVDPVAGSAVKVLYNNAAGGLAWLLPYPDGQMPSLKFGFNNWRSAEGTVKMTPAEVEDAKPDEVWYEAEVEAPFDAAVFNFCINYYEHFDNNGGTNYKAALLPPAGIKSLDEWQTALVNYYRTQESDARYAARERERERNERRRLKKEATLSLVKAVQRRQIRHVLFTEPEVVRVGDEVTLYYNPQDTPLRGQGKVYVQGGWNRWTHRRTFGPIEMTPPALGTHFQATVKVPKDVFLMDFVFSNVPSGNGIYDNRGGLDYHLPVEGGVVRERPLHVVHIAVEMAPIAKVGGLGDVVTALGRAVKEQGHLVEVILPRYDFFLQSPLLGATVYETEFAWGGTYIYVSKCMVEGLMCFFIEPKNGFFSTPTVYGRYDDEVRFDFFCRAALEFLLQSQRQPDILHCHDWSTAHVAKAFWEGYANYGLWKPRIVFTIHNMEFGAKKIAEAAFYCQRFTTVSPTYAFEIGGSPLIAPNNAKFMGIRNGIDYELWDPENSLFLPLPYGPDNLREGKDAARRALRQRLGLTAWGDKFIVGVVSRLTAQKGVGLIKHAVWRTLERGGQFVLLGSAPDPKVQAEFNALAGQYGGDCASFYFGYDEPLSHLIYAACDMVLVPSIFEPCGLTQMIAMRYGSVPVVRHTGGLRDTVFDIDYDKARAAWDMYGSSDYQRDGLDATNGFAFGGTDTGALDSALNRAIDAWYNDRAWFHGLQKRVMEQDWTWTRPALDYIELYFSAIKS